MGRQRLDQWQTDAEFAVGISRIDDRCRRRCRRHHAATVTIHYISNSRRRIRPRTDDDAVLFSVWLCEDEESEVNADTAPRTVRYRIISSEEEEEEDEEEDVDGDPQSYDPENTTTDALLYD